VRLAKAGERWRAGSRALGEAIERRLGLAQRRLEPLAGRLQALSPLKVLERGYSIVQTEDGRIVKRAIDAPEGASIRVRLYDGRLTALVRESRTD
jgi:exodeoxyribonuclease VII large subunit